MLPCTLDEFAVNGRFLHRRQSGVSIGPDDVVHPDVTISKIQLEE